MKKILLALILTSQTVMAKPFVPDSDSLILAKLPKVDKRLGNIRASLKKNPENLDFALLLANKYLELGRKEADPRYFSYIESVLLPWWKEAEPANEILILRAYVNQYAHKFDDALLDLNKILKKKNDAQALLMRSAIYRLQAKYDKALVDCNALTNSVSSLTKASCLASIKSLNGQAAESYENLEKELIATRASDSEKVFALTSLGEIASRLGNFSLAEKHFKSALELNPSDVYLMVVYADLLLDKEMPEKVLSFLEQPAKANEGLMIRYTKALKELGIKEFKDASLKLKESFAKSRTMGDIYHQREEALIALDLFNDVKSAHDFAKDNWRMQKEPIDASILIRTAIASKDKDSIKEITKFIEQNRIEDIKLEELLEIAKTI